MQNRWETLFRLSDTVKFEMGILQAQHENYDVLLRRKIAANATIRIARRNTNWIKTHGMRLPNALLFEQMGF